jgi:hypothetical protein
MLKTLRDKLLIGLPPLLASIVGNGSQACSGQTLQEIGI